MAEEKEQLKQKIANLSALAISSEKKEEMIDEITKRRFGIFKLLIPIGVLGALALLLPIAKPETGTRAAGLTVKDIEQAETRITTVEESVLDEFSEEEAEFTAIENDLENMEI